MRALIRAATIGVLTLVACDGPVEPHSTGSLALQTVRAANAPPVHVDSGHVTIRGTSTSAMKSARPGDQVKFDGLQPGPYDIIVDAFGSGGVVVELGRTNSVTVTAGQTAQATVTVVPVPLPSSPPPSQDVAQAATVTLSTGMANPSGTLTYTWTQISGPRGAWSGPWTGTGPTFTVPNDVVTLQYSLVVSNGVGSSTPQTATIWVLQDPAHAIWVSPTGSANAKGTRSDPMASLQAALDSSAARSIGGAVYVVAGTYAENIVLPPKVSVFGGYNPTTFVRDIPNNVTVISSVGTIAVVADESGPLTVDGFTIRSADATTAGGSSIGFLVKNSPGVVINRNTIIAGNGLAGSDGSAGSAGRVGNAGANSAGSGSGSGAAGGARTQFCIILPSGLRCGPILSYEGGSGGDGGNYDGVLSCSTAGAGLLGGGGGLAGTAGVGGGGSGGGGIGGNGLPGVASSVVGGPGAAFGTVSTSEYNPANDEYD